MRIAASRDPSDGTSGGVVCDDARGDRCLFLGRDPRMMLRSRSRSARASNGFREHVHEIDSSFRPRHLRPVAIAGAASERVAATARGTSRSARAAGTRESGRLARSARDKAVHRHAVGGLPGRHRGLVQGGRRVLDRGARRLVRSRRRRSARATGAADVIDPESPFALRVSGKTARALIVQLAQRTLCSANRCALGAIACFTDRHDERAAAVAPSTRTARIPARSTSRAVAAFASASRAVAVSNARTDSTSSSRRASTLAGDVGPGLWRHLGGDL